MNPLAKLRSLLPASSRSFHGLYGEVVELHYEVRQLRTQMRDLSSHVAWLHSQTRDSLAKEVHGVSAQAQLLGFSLFAREDESYDEARARFHSGLPKATGDARLVQLASLQLLHDFHEFCLEHGLQYWLLSGTLLGAVRHGGFVPWDDDADLGMTRADVRKVLQLTAEDTRFIATEIFDYYPTCRQVRFRYRDEDIPCFIDLFLFDYATVEPYEAYRRMREDRAALKERLASDEELSRWNAGNQLVSANCSLGQRIGGYFDDIVADEYAADGFLTDDPEKAKAVIWALDNVDPFTGRDLCFDYDTLFPVAPLRFENADFSAPHNPGKALHVLFGDYLALPNDIVSHMEHVTKEQLGDPATRKALSILADSERSAG